MLLPLGERCGQMNKNEKYLHEHDLFVEERDSRSREDDINTRSGFVKDRRGWCLFGPQDVRSYKRHWSFSLQMATGQKEPRVRVGCRYYTLAQAWAHWGVRAKTGRYTKNGVYQTWFKNEAQQAVAIIRLMLLQAQAYNLLSVYKPVPKFDSTLTKRKRR